MSAWKYEEFKKSVDHPGRGIRFLGNAPIEFIRRYARECADLQLGERDKRISELEAAIRKVLADTESQPGGWGPDHTMTFVLADALKRNQVLLPDGSCPCRMEGDVLFPCERHAIHRG